MTAQTEITHKKTTRRTFTLTSLGCPKNRVDSENILHHMTQGGFTFTDDTSVAEIIIVNTCAFIRPAVEEAIAVILELRQTSPSALIVAAGCLPLRYKEELAVSLTEVDLFVTPSQIQILPALLNQHLSKKGFADDRMNFSTVKSGRVITTPGYAYLKIADGCARSCRYCTIPQIRGPLRSTAIQDLVHEASFLADRGVKELILVAQDTTSYGRDLGTKNALVKLLSALENISGIEWIRLMYLHPAGIPKGLRKLINESRKILPYLDIPFQHISEKVLRAMGRPWKGDYIRKLVKSLRDEIPGLVLRTSVMVGFPQETDQDFNELLDFLREYQIERVGVFQYCPEDGTPAFVLGDPIPARIKKQRANEIKKLNTKLTAKRNRSRIGAIEKAFIEGISEESELLLQGRTWDQAPEVDGVLYVTEGTLETGRIQPVRITYAHGQDLFGTLEIA
ncbi:MAG: ribosomal protein methylthiotransferase [Thermodesulfobacteriota bacterium]|nr:ribosomal protein methylthiotransferase [Thermodesulfobacteriota bacterium]